MGGGDLRGSLGYGSHHPDHWYFRIVRSGRGSPFWRISPAARSSVDTLDPRYFRHISPDYGRARTAYKRCHLELFMSDADAGTDTEKIGLGNMQFDLAHALVSGAVILPL